MTLRALSDAGLADAGPADPVRDDRRALIFVLDAPYLRPFKVLLYSLLATGSVTDLPVIVLTQDRRVAEDAVVRALADRLVQIGEAEIARFSAISPERVAANRRLGWIAKYTFLKWLIFDDWGVDRLLYIDADIVCGRPCGDIFEAAGDAHMAVCPRMDREIWRRPDESLRPDAEAAGIARTLLTEGGDIRRHWVNSGVMVLGGDCLTTRFRDRLIAAAAAEPRPAEQGYITDLLRQEPAFPHRLLPSRYNFTANALHRLALADQIAILPEITFLHYPGGKKPWSRPLRSGAKLASMVWRRWETEALDRSALLGRPTPLRRALRDLA